MANPQSTPTQDFPQEEWRAVIGYEGIYEASSFGRVRRIGKQHGATQGRELQQAPGWGGYPRVTLSNAGTSKRVFVHVIVAAAFVGPCPVGHEVNHKDRDRTNPRAGNLEYLTRSANMRHAFASGAKIVRGESKASTKLTEASVRSIRASGEPSRVLAARYGVCHKTVQLIKNRRKWAHVV